MAAALGELSAVSPAAWIVVIVVLLSLFGSLWRVFHVLYVKPRDFQIETLEREIAKLKSEEPGMVVQPVPTDDEAAGPLPRSSPEPVREEDPEEACGSISAELVGNTDPTAECLRDLRLALQYLGDRSETDLQRQGVFEFFVGKHVIWSGFVHSVSMSHDGVVSVGVAPDKDEQWKWALVDFDESRRGELLRLAQGDRVVISGSVERIHLRMPVVAGSSIEKTVP